MTKNSLKVIATRLNAATTVKPGQLFVKDLLSHEEYQVFTALVNCAKVLDVGYSKVCSDLLSKKYGTANAILNDASQILKYFGGDCYKYVGSELFLALDDACKTGNGAGLPVR